MGRLKRYTLLYDRQVAWHLSGIERRYHSLIRRKIEVSLRYEPEAETRNRKPLSRPSMLGTSWELRFGPQNSFRVFYRTDHASREVYVLGIGVKKGNRLFLGTEEFEL
jgi:hypothetical protein